ncbi:MAG: ATPase [Arachnia propionica]|nr:MAG: ATPase [Arachnia propionica]
MLGFTSTAWLGTLLLLLPIAKRGEGSASVLEAFFTATSAVCVTGLTIVDTQTYWSEFGLFVILVLIQIGGFGVMTLASVIGMAVLGNLPYRTKVTAAAEFKTEGYGRVRTITFSIIKITLLIEGIVAAILFLRFWLGGEHSFIDSIWYGVFHAVSAFNNAGFSLYSDSMIRYVTDPTVCIPIMVAIILGGLGFPVLMQLRHYFKDGLKWTMNTRIVLVMTVTLLVLSSLYVLALEWNNPLTLGELPWYDKLLPGIFQAVQTRTAGFNSIPVGGMHSATWLGLDFFMFVGGGPAGTAGGVKVTTIAVLVFIVWTEVRGEAAVNIMGKRLARSVHRQAIAVVGLAMALVFGATLAITLFSPYNLDKVLFEVMSAFGTVGLSTGITAQLDPASLLVLCGLMYVGRLGPITFASSLALRERKRLYELPKERPIIG